jgi:hypothetical protein
MSTTPAALRSSTAAMAVVSLLRKLMVVPGSLPVANIPPGSVAKEIPPGSVLMTVMFANTAVAVSGTPPLPFSARDFTAVPVHAPAGYPVPLRVSITRDVGTEAKPPGAGVAPEVK